MDLPSSLQLLMLLCFFVCLFFTTWMSWSLKISLILDQGPITKLLGYHRSFHQALSDYDVLKMQVNVGNTTQMKL